MRKMKERFDQGKRRKTNNIYHRYTDKIQRLRKKWDSWKGKEGKTQEHQAIQEAIQRVEQCRKRLPSGDPFDDGYKRLYYCRYADDYVIGIIGSRADAEEIRQAVKQFIQGTLNLSIAEEKAHICHSKEGVTFLGYWLKTHSGERIVKVKRGPRHTTFKAISERIQLHIPPGKLEKFCTTKRYGTYQATQAIHKKEFTPLSDAEIILAYNGELRGLANYYALAYGVKQRMNKLAYIWQTSLLKTLAHKHQTSVSKIATRLKTNDGYAHIVRDEHKTRIIRLFRLKDLKPSVSSDHRIDTPPSTYDLTLSRSELIRRLNARKCEYCETIQGPFEVHHIRKLKDVAQGKERWQQMMAARRRKTLVLCRTCHHLLHAGKLPDKEHLKKQSKGRAVCA